MKSELNKLAKFLKEKRTLASLSQKDVATKLGYSTSQFISNWERGISQPPIHTLRTLAQMYAVSSDQMFQVLLSATIDQVQIELKAKFYATEDSKETSRETHLEANWRMMSTVVVSVWYSDSADNLQELFKIHSNTTLIPKYSQNNSWATLDQPVKRRKDIDHH